MGPRGMRDRSDNPMSQKSTNGLLVYQVTALKGFYCTMHRLDGTVVMSSANGLVGTGFASQYRLQPRAGF